VVDDDAHVTITSPKTRTVDSIQLTRDGASPSSPLRVRSPPPFPGNREGLFFFRTLTIDRFRRALGCPLERSAWPEAGACLCRRGRDEEAATRLLGAMTRARGGSQGASSKALLRARAILQCTTPRDVATTTTPGICWLTIALAGHPRARTVAPNSAYAAHDMSRRCSPSLRPRASRGLVTLSALFGAA
jgi:hypothetical protein